jgi:competence protein ComGF
MHLTNTDNINMYMTKPSNIITYTNVGHNKSTTVRHKINSKNIHDCSEFRIFNSNNKIRICAAIPLFFHIVPAKTESLIMS